MSNMTITIYSWIIYGQTFYDINFPKDTTCTWSYKLTIDKKHLEQLYINCRSKHEFLKMLPLIELCFKAKQQTEKKRIR